MLRDTTRDESKTLGDFVDFLTMHTYHKAVMKILQHDTYQDQRTYRDLGLFGPAPAHGHARTATRPKRKVVADGAGGGSSPHHARTKRARRGRRNNVADK